MPLCSQWQARVHQNKSFLAFGEVQKQANHVNNKGNIELPVTVSGSHMSVQSFLISMFVGETQTC